MISTARRSILLAIPALAFGAAARAAAPTMLRVGVGAQVTSLDPHFHNISPNNAFASMIFDNLLEMDPNSRPVACLAESWRPVGEDVWEFRLRQGVRFQDGTPFTADDVAFTLERIPNVQNSPGSFRTYTRSIRSAEVVDDHTIRFHTNGPDPLLPPNLAQVPMLSRRIHGTATTEDFNTGRAAIGTGPFRLTSHQPGSRAMLARSDTYWGDPVPWQEVEYRMITNPAARTAALLAGDVDIIDQVPTADLARIRRNPRLRLSEINSLRLIYIHFDHMRTGPSPFITGNDGQPLDRNPLKDLCVRRALSLAVDRNAIVSRVMEGQATPINQFMPPGTFGHVPDLDPPPPDLAGARRLLAEAGFPDGFQMVLHGPNDRYPNDARIVQAMAQMWTRIGIRTTVDVSPFASFVSRASRQEFSAFLVSWGSSTGEPSAGMRSVLASYDRTRGTGSVNRGRYSNAAFDAALAKATRELDDNRREALLQDAMRLAMQDAAIIPVHLQRNVWAMQRGIEHTPRTDERTRPQDARPAQEAAAR